MRNPDTLAHSPGHFGTRPRTLRRQTLSESVWRRSSTRSFSFACSPPTLPQRCLAYPPSQPHEALRGCLRLTGRPRDCSQYWCDRCTGCRCVGQNGAVARLSQVWATVAQLSPANRRRAPGCSQRCACMLPVSQGDCGRAPVHARCSVPWRRSPAASGATAGISCASGAVAGDSQAPCPVAALGARHSRESVWRRSVLG